MVLLAILFQLLGFFLLYNTSQRAALHIRVARAWAQQHRVLANALGGAMIVVSFVLFSLVFSLGTSLVIGTVTLMMVSSFVVILCPLKSL